MREPLDYYADHRQSLLHWVRRFVRYKINTLSNSAVTDQRSIARAIDELKDPKLELDDIDQIIKKIRKAGMGGVTVFFLPLRQFILHVSGAAIDSLKRIDEEYIIEYLTPATGGLSDATKKNHRTAMINFFKYLDKNNEDLDGRSHIFNIELKNWQGLRGKSGVKLPAHLNEDEIALFLDHLDTHKFRKETGDRMRCLLRIIYYSGIRVSEATGLLRKDVSLEGDHYIFTIRRGKGNKERIVSIRRENIGPYLIAHLGNAEGVDSPLLFCTKVNGEWKEISQAYISRTVENVLLEAGLRKKKNGAHLLRHSYATLVYKKTGDIRLLQELLGHQSITTTSIYTHLTGDRAKQAADLI